MNTTTETFPPDIEETWDRYVKFQEQRLKDAGLRHPWVYLTSDGKACATGLLEDRRQEGKSIPEAVDKYIEWLQNADHRKADKIAKLEAQIQELKGGGE